MKCALATIVVLASTIFGAAAQAAVYDFAGTFSWGSAGGAAPISASGNFAGQADWSEGINSTTAASLSSLSAFSIGTTAQDLTTSGVSILDTGSVSVFSISGLVNGVNGLAQFTDDYRLTFFVNPGIDFNTPPATFTMTILDGEIANDGLGGTRALGQLNGSVTFSLPTAVPLPAGFPMFLTGFVLLAALRTRS